MLLVALSLVAMVPLWIPEFPPMVDLPQHAAQIALFRALLDPGFRFASIYEIHWFTPYLIGYMLAYPLTFVFSVATALKIVVSAALAAIPAATGEVLKEVGEDPFLAVLAIPGLLGVCFYWGMLNFMVATPIGLLLLVFALRYVERPALGRFAAVAVLANLLFFSHVLMCGFFVAIAIAMVAMRSRSWRQTSRLLFPLFTLVPLMMLWTLDARANLTGDRGIDWDWHWFASSSAASMDGRLVGFFPRIFGLPREAFSPWVILLLVGIGGAAWMAGVRFRREAWRWSPVAICTVVLLFAPSYMSGSGLLYQRFALLWLPLLALALTTRESGNAKSGQILLVVLLMAWTGTIAERSLRYARESAGMQSLIERMAPNEKVLSLVIDRDSAVAPVPVYLHQAAWYSAEKRGVEDVSFALYFFELVRYRYDYVPRAGLAFGWMPEHFRWKNFKGSGYRYFLIRQKQDTAEMFRGADCDVHLVARSGEWWLWEAAPACYR